MSQNRVPALGSCFFEKLSLLSQYRENMESFIWFGNLISLYITKGCCFWVVFLTKWYTSEAPTYLWLVTSYLIFDTHHGKGTTILWTILFEWETRLTRSPLHEPVSLNLFWLPGLGGLLSFPETICALMTSWQYCHKRIFQDGFAPWHRTCN